MVIPEEEARRLLMKSEGLAWIKNRWVAVDPEKLKQTLDAYEKSRGMLATGEFSFRDAMRIQLNPDLPRTCRSVTGFRTGKRHMA